MNRKAIIISISGLKLSRKEKYLIKNEKPWGVILFKRNIKSLNQSIKLIESIRKTIKDKKYPILLDEEGGRVTRLSNLFDNSIYSQKYFGKLYEKNKLIGNSVFKNYILSISLILNKIGININTVPVLDLLYKKKHKIIGDRSFSSKPHIVSNLGEICVKNYKKNKIGTVIKHIPGHGRSKSDSHYKLPIIKEKFQILKQTDFKCFKNNKSFFAMTAHILYNKLDKRNCATLSKKIINEIIRKEIGFKGILISDDISMKALKKNIYENALLSLSAGCNLVLYCSGKISESDKLLKMMPYIDEFTKKKTSEFYKFLS